MKFVLFVEGDTEKALPAFLKRWLDARLDSPVGIQAVRFVGGGEFVRDAPKKAELYLNAPRNDVIAVIGLLDLYELYLPYPASKTTAGEKVVWAKQHLEAKVSQAQFHQFFAVHETEAWLLSQTSIFPADVRSSLTPKAVHPETVNSEEPPGKLLERLYRTHLKRSYRKAVDGPKLFGVLDPAMAYAKCPNLKSLLDEMLRLAQGAQPA